MNTAENQQLDPSQSSDEYRQRVLAKVRKLLTLARDGRGNEQEAETALRQAQMLMAKFNIEESETITKDLREQQTEAIIRMWRKASMYVEPAGHVAAKEFPVWGSILARGVAIFCDCRVIIARNVKEANGQAAVFAGYRTDVEVACWTFDYLIECIRRRCATFHNAVLQYKRTNDMRVLHEEFGLPVVAILGLKTTISRTYNNTFRVFMASRLQTRMKEMKEQWAKEQTGGGTSLMVMDMKLEVLRKLFGEDKPRAASTSNVSYGAALAGENEANKTRLQPNPLSNSAEPRSSLTR